MSESRRISLGPTVVQQDAAMARLTKLRADPAFAETRLKRPKRERLKRAKSTSRASPEYTLHVAAVIHIRKRLKPHALCWHTPNQSRGALDRMHKDKMGALAGIPDLFVLHQGELVAIELKAPGGTRSNNQKHAHSALLSAGCETITCDDLESVDRFLVSKHMYS